MKLTHSKKGCLLIAELGLTGDASFSRAIIYLAEHNEEGSLGFVLNKKADVQLSDVLPEIEQDYDLFIGGPVERDNLYYIHELPKLIPDSVQITDNIYWGGDFQKLYDKLRQGEIPPEKIKFFLGYSGWVPNQLESEVKTEAWIVCENEIDIFHKDVSTMWKEKLKELGGEYLIWANSPENPLDN